MKSISLIQTLVLLHENKCFKKSVICKSSEIDYFEPTKKNVMKAKKLAAQIIGRDLCSLPLKARILLLLIEQMVEKTASKRKRSEHQFSWESVQQYTGWSQRLLKTHMGRLKGRNYLVYHPQKGLFSLLYEGRPIEIVKHKFLPS